MFKILKTFTNQSTPKHKIALLLRRIQGLLMWHRKGVVPLNVNFDISVVWGDL